MDRASRRVFNAHFTPELYESHRASLESRLNCRFAFRLAESPVFLPPDLREQLVIAANAIVDQISVPSCIEKMKKAIPPEWDTPGMDALPSFAQVDFAIVRDANGQLAPRLIELQGFPSLSALQTLHRDAWTEALHAIPELDRDWSCWFPPFDRESYLALARKTICGNHDAQSVVLMDLDPPTQKTVPDFAATKMLFGVDAVDPSALTRHGRTLFRTLPNGREVEVRRIYHRVVFDELARKKRALPFDYREELDLEWAPHPNWYWVWSKYSLPLLDHPTVPKARFVSDLREIPPDLQESYVLKPLFSFAGGGVNVEPTREDVARIPDEEAHRWCLQEKIEYAPALEAADGGGVKVEVRMMFFRPDGETRMILAQNLCRLSRGRMLGVDFNKEFTWVGSSIALWPA
ncbi:MAG TPA: hypothetical protein VIL97_10365 [Thermoanaerobaculia bacterium]